MTLMPSTQTKQVQAGINFLQLWMVDLNSNNKAKLARLMVLVVRSDRKSMELLYVLIYFYENSTLHDVMVDHRHF